MDSAFRNFSRCSLPSGNQRSIFWPVPIILILAYVAVALLFRVGVRSPVGAGVARSAVQLRHSIPLAGDVLEAQQQRAVDACRTWADTHGRSAAGAHIAFSDPVAARFQVATRGAACTVEDRNEHPRLLAAWAIP